MKRDKELKKERRPKNDMAVRPARIEDGRGLKDPMPVTSLPPEPPPSSTLNPGMTVLIM